MVSVMASRAAAHRRAQAKHQQDWCAELDPRAEIGGHFGRQLGQPVLVAEQRHAGVEASSLFMPERKKVAPAASSMPSSIGANGKRRASRRIRSIRGDRL